MGERGRGRVRGALVGVVVAFACGPIGPPRVAAPPSEAIAEAKAAVRAADVAGAARYPRARLHRALALEALEELDRSVAHGWYERAEELALRARADAELADALARSAAAEETAEALAGPRAEPAVGVPARGAR